MTQNLQNDRKSQAEIDARHPFGGMGDPAEVAKAVLFLASDDCGWVQGVNLPVSAERCPGPLGWDIADCCAGGWRIYDHVTCRLLSSKDTSELLMGSPLRAA